MFRMEIGAIVEIYLDLDSAMIDCFGVYPDADFSNWHETATETWMDIYEDNNITSSIVGRIIEI